MAAFYKMPESSVSATCLIKEIYWATDLIVQIKDYNNQKTSVSAWPTFNAHKESLARLRLCANCSELSGRHTSALLKPNKEDKEAV